MPKEVSYLMRHRIAEPLEGFIILMPVTPYRRVYRDFALLYFGPHLNNGICWFSARYAFVVRVGKRTWSALVQIVLDMCPVARAWLTLTL